MTPAFSSIPSLVVVVAAILVDSQGRVLIGQRPDGKADAGLWEFPGGKVEAGESPERALVRELDEELGIGVAPEDLSPLTFASRALSRPVGGAHLLMPVYVCRKWSGVPEARDHTALQWVFPAELPGWPMPEADGPLLPFLMDRL